MDKMPSEKVARQIASKRVIVQNADAFEVYDAYKKALDIVERAELASGKRIVFKSGTGSTLNFEVNRNGAYSTTAQKI